MEKVSYYTEEGFEKLSKALHSLKTKERKQVIQQIADAKEKGDLSENAEYDAAKEAQEILEKKISQLEKVVANARIRSKADVDTSKVSILSTVKIKNKQYDQVFTYTLVAVEEADLKAGKISVESPIGQGLLGKKVGQIATIQAPSGEMQFEVLEISI